MATVQFHHPKPPEPVGAYRMLMCSSYGTQLNDSVYDVQFLNIQLPVDGVADHSDDRWYVAAESFVTSEFVKGGGGSSVPFMVTTDLPTMNSYSNLPNQSMPLVLLGPGSEMNSASMVAVDSVGHRLSTSPSLLFQSGALRVRVTGIDGSALATDAGQVWTLILSVYRLGYK